MKHTCWLKVLSVIFLMTPVTLHAETNSKKNPKLEDMSAAELKAALKKSHSEIESRLGSSADAEKSDALENSPRSKETASSLSEKRIYESSAQSQINALDYKIKKFENAGNKNWGYAQKDAQTLISLQSKAREQLIKIRSNNTSGWKTNKQILDSLLRSASNYN